MQTTTKALIDYVSEETGKRIGLKGESTFIDLATGEQIDPSIVNECAKKKESDDIEAEKNKGLSEINTWYEVEAAKLTRGYPNTEITTWNKQEQEARAYQADITAQVPFIKELALARGVELDVLVVKIIEKADAYAVNIGTLTGQRQKKEDELLASLGS